MLALLVLTGALVCGAYLPPTLVWNQWIAQNFASNAYTAAPEAREIGLYLLAAHDGLNSVRINDTHKYTPYIAYLDNGIHNNNSDDVIVGAAYRILLRYTITTRVTTDGTALFFPLTGPGNQSYYLDLIDAFYASFIAGLDPQPSVGQIAQGQALGEAAANSVWNQRANDGFNRTIPIPYFPFPSFQPGKWYPRPNEAQVYPLKSYETPLSVGSCYRDLVAVPPFDSENSDYLADLLYTKDKGAKFNSTRTAAESTSAIFAVILAGQRFMTATLTQLYPRLVAYQGYDVRDFTRLHALIAMAQSDSYTCVTTQKAVYNFWRPWQVITRANEWASVFPKLAAVYDPSWQSFQTTPNNPEYPAGHPTASGCLAQTLRRVVGWEVIPGGAITVFATPTVSETYLTVGELEEKMVNARVFGGMHLRASGRVGVNLGHKLSDYTVTNYLLPALPDHGN